MESLSPYVSASLFIAAKSFFRRTSQGRHIHYECLLDCVLVCVKIDQSSSGGVRVFPYLKDLNLLLRTGQIRGREIIE